MAPRIAGPLGALPLPVHLQGALTVLAAEEHFTAVARQARAWAGA